MRGALSSTLPILALACAVAGPGCGRQQWKVSVTTNATIPKMGDRLRVEILTEDGQPACDDCVRELDASSRSAWPITFGVVDTDAAVRIRARLYRSRAFAPTSRSIDVVARLPDRGAVDAAKIDVSFFLPLSCFGFPPDLASKTTCRVLPDFSTGMGPEPTLDFGLPRDPFGEVVGCTRPAPEGMACVGGGLILLGDERFEALASDFPARPEVVSGVYDGDPLMMDVDETTVGAVRALVKRGALRPTESGPSALRRRGASGTLEEACTYLGPDDPANDALPINCIGQELAQDACAARGLRLPFEAEWEFAAGNGVAETTYPWGDVEGERAGAFLYERIDTVCGRSVVGRGRGVISGESTGCGERFGWGPVAGGNAEDVTRTGIRNMGGNVAEWTYDEFAFYDEPCWSEVFTFGCFEPSQRLTGRFAPYRGGSWARPAQSTVVVGRYAAQDGAPSPYVGLRCAATESELR